MNGRLTTVNILPRGYFFISAMNEQGRWEQFYSNVSHIRTSDTQFENIRPGFFAKFVPVVSKKENGLRTATEVEIFIEDPEAAGGIDALAGEGQ